MPDGGGTLGKFPQKPKLLPTIEIDSFLVFQAWTIAFWHIFLNLSVIKIYVKFCWFYFFFKFLEQISVSEFRE